MIQEGIAAVYTQAMCITHKYEELWLRLQMHLDSMLELVEASRVQRISMRLVREEMFVKVSHAQGKEDEYEGWNIICVYFLLT